MWPRSAPFWRSSRSVALVTEKPAKYVVMAPGKSSIKTESFEFWTMWGMSSTEDDLVTPLVNGQDIASPAEFGELVSISAQGLDNFGAAVFDSDPLGPNAFGPDPDLLVDFGNVLILQENQVQSVPGIFDVPDDAQLGGTLVFDFTASVELRRVDLIDVCPGPPLQDVTLTLRDQEGDTRTYFVPGGWTSDVFFDGPPGFGTLDLTTLAPQPGFLTAATAAEDAAFDPTGVVRLEVFFLSSAALDNLEFCPEIEPAVARPKVRAAPAAPVGR